LNVDHPGHLQLQHTGAADPSPSAVSAAAS
jgi:hypothetical protein